MLFVCRSICLHLYLKVVQGLKKAKLQEAAKYIWYFCLLLPLFGVLVLYLFDGFGLETGVPFGVCFIKNVSLKEYYRQRYGWIYPSIALSVVCFFLMCSIMYHVAQTVLSKTKLNKDSQGVVSGTTEEIEQRRTKKAWKKMLWLNQKTFSFVFVFVLCNTVAYGILLKMFEVDYDEAGQDIADYVGCLIGIAADPAFVLTKEDARTVPESVCGDPDDALSIWSNLYYIVLWLQVTAYALSCMFLTLSLFHSVFVVDGCATFVRVWHERQDQEVHGRNTT